jgi:hypothetical protein
VDQRTDYDLRHDPVNTLPCTPAIPEESKRHYTSSNTENGKAKLRVSFPIILLTELLIKAVHETRSKLYSYNYAYENGNIIKRANRRRFIVYFRPDHRVGCNPEKKDAVEIGNIEA